jgi:hypothetical protein
VHDVALVELQVSVDVPPGAMTEGVALNVAVGKTSTVAVATELVPPGPVHSSEYEVAVLTAPVPWLPLTPRRPLQPPEAVHEVALVEFHVNVAAPPATTTVGAAVNVTVAAGIIVTVLTRDAVVPPGPVQTSENDVGAVNGPVLTLPLALRIPLQPPEALHEVALAELHVSTDAFPETTAVGAADRAAVGAGINVTVATAGGVAPPGPVHIIEYTVVAVSGRVL